MRQGRKVLVIDDSPFIYKAVKRALEPEGMIVVDNAMNGKIGLEMVQEYNPDIITLDVTMPVLDGIGTARELFKSNPNSKIVMISAMGDKDLLNQAREIGVKHFLTKPFKPNQLLSIIDELLEEGV